MGLILSILLMGLVASLSPITIVVFILVLESARAGVNATAFLVGWTASLTVVFTLGYLLSSSSSVQHRDGRTVVLVVEVVLGCALVVAGVRQWRSRAEAPDTTDGWQARLLSGGVDDLSPRGAALFGVLKQPWAITTAAAVLVVHHQPPRLVALIAFACFAVASTASVVLMYLFYARKPAEAQAYLAHLRDRAIDLAPAVFAVVAGVAGAFLVLDGLVDLASVLR
jgi:Sap-like sulfolipid-1-addressing protein